jgi:hypothetical protein
MLELADRVTVGAVQPQQLAAVDRTLTGERDQSGLAVALGGQGMGQAREDGPATT